MDIAKEWGIPPYKVNGGSKLLWYVRYTAVREARIKKNHREEIKHKNKEGKRR